MRYELKEKCLLLFHLGIEDKPLAATLLITLSLSPLASVFSYRPVYFCYFWSGLCFILPEIKFQINDILQRVLQWTHFVHVMRNNKYKVFQLIVHGKIAEKQSVGRNALQVKEFEGMVRLRYHLLKVRVVIMLSNIWWATQRDKESQHSNEFFFQEYAKSFVVGPCPYLSYYIKISIGITNLIHRIIYRNKQNTFYKKDQIVRRLMLHHKRTNIRTAVRHFAVTRDDNPVTVSVYVKYKFDT